MRRSWLQFVNKNYFSRSYSKKNVLTSRLQFETLDPGDNAHPIWQFFDNIALDNSTANEENVGSARCKDCLGLFPFPETDVEPLEEHMRSEHRPNLDSYENLCEGNCR